MLDWDSIRPEHIGEYMNFERGESEWEYQPKNVSMANKQAEGVAYLCRLIAREGIALLADEVGMGKTFQALGVMRLLWQKKPDARVLVMAPNKNICNHWVREYNHFLTEHCRPADTPKNAGEAKICSSLDDLCAAVKDSKQRFFLVTIHSLSRLAGEDENIDAVEAHAARVHQTIKSVLPGGFDLLVIDEAHYFRNVEGGSQRVAAGKVFFGVPAQPLARKVLLMTATPSHKNMQDVGRILHYFKDIDPQQTAASLLQRFALRRLRLMRAADGSHVNKHHYRREVAVPAQFGTNSMSELFFALYQKQLASRLEGKQPGRKMLYGYLEGFESAGPDTEATDTTGRIGATSPDNVGAKDYYSAPDSELLRNLSAQFHKLFGYFPDHPKYDATIAQLVRYSVFDANVSLHEHKHLVFVRRIPSVRELTQRVNRAYDRQFIPTLLNAWGLGLDDPAAKKWEHSNWSRAGFAALTKNEIEKRTGRNTIATNDEAALEPDAESPDSVLVDDRLGSIVANLFIIKRSSAQTGGNDERTDCANVRLRFSKPESLFSLFLEPAADYRNAPYLNFHKAADGRKQFYANAARDVRRSQHGLVTPDSLPEYKYDEPLGTAWGLMYALLSDTEKALLESWHAPKRKGTLENFANYLREGFLYASPVMIELYCWFTQFQVGQWQQDCSRYQHASAQQRYQWFLSYAELKVPGSLMLVYFREALGSFEKLCEKIADHGLCKWDQKWSQLTQMHNPAWYASSETGDRERLILGFNSPFFPNVLVATSVFQEGVNLHLQCRQVHHYGIAWTPGDNEQRAGRVDRLFGRVNQELAQHGKTTLDIHFPYLERSFDEDQVGSFIRHKHHVEAAMDRCQQDGFDTAIDITLTPGEWKQYLRKPADDAMTLDDPYPAYFEEKPE